MAHATPIASTPAFLEIDFDQLIGLVLVAGLPALFWTGVLYVAFASFGATLTFAAACTTAVGIAAFLGMIFRTLRRNKT